MTPQIVFEDEDILVLGKPAGITVNRSETTKEETVQDWVEKRIKFENDDSEFYKRSGIAHRIDKETSGLLLIAKNKEAFENLQSQFKSRVVKKTYLALVHGIVKPEVGEINIPVGRLPWNRKRFGVLAGGREAKTNYKVKKILKIGDEDLSLLELCPETGRTHQIRVHLKYINHPIFADSLYAGRKTARNDRKVLPRVFLHAAKILFKHPSTGKTMEFESALPKELGNLVKS